MKNYYQILGVSRYSDEAMIRDAFKAMMSKDLASQNSFSPTNPTAQDLAEAFLVLNDTERRKEYDAAFFGQNAYKHASSSTPQNADRIDPSGALVRELPAVAQYSDHKKMPPHWMLFAIIPLAAGIFLFERASAPPKAPGTIANPGSIVVPDRKPNGLRWGLAGGGGGGFAASGQSGASPPDAGASVPELPGAPRAPGLDDLSSDERQSAETACEASKSQGADPYSRCLQSQIARLRR